MTSHSKEPSSLAEVLIPALKGFFISVISAAILLFSLTALAYSMEDPDSMTALFGCISLYLSAAICGAVTARTHGDTGAASVLAAAMSGVIFLAVLISMSLLPAEAPSEALSPLVKVLMYALVPVISSLAGLILKRKPSRRMRHKRRR